MWTKLESIAASLTTMETLQILTTTSLRNVIIVDKNTKLVNVMPAKQCVTTVRKLDTGGKCVIHLNIAVYSEISMDSPIHKEELMVKATADLMKLMRMSTLHLGNSGSI